MSWYKKSIEIENFRDRNIVNDNISVFKDMASTLSYLQKYVYQNAPHARQVILAIAENKKLSSFPTIKEILIKAHRKALDSYIFFASACEEAVSKLYTEVKKLEKEVAKQKAE